MAHVFISYSSAHRDLTEQLAVFLEGCGLDVWWDRELVARGPFDAQIQEQLRTSGCIVVIWTDGAVVSEWVLREANFAFAADKLVNVRADDLPPQRLPQPFGSIDAHRLSELALILRDVLAVREGRLLLEDKRESLPSPGERTPSMLLQAKYGVVPFTGSAGIKADMIAWALSRDAYAKPTRRAAGRLIHGSGGLGKTRLLIEVADDLRRAGWSAGFLARAEVADDAAKRERRAKALSHLIRGASDKGLLLVMDYAESRSDEVVHLARAIQSRPADDTRPIRLVLLSRGAGAWWERLTEDEAEVQVLMTTPRGLDAHELEGLATGQERLDLFVVAASVLAGLLAEDGYQLPTGPPDIARIGRIETGEGYERPLAITMEALLYLAAMAPGANQPGVHNLLASILGLERQHWKKLLGPLSSDSRGNPDLDLRRAVAQVSVVQGVTSRASVEALFMADRFYGDERRNRSAVRQVTDNITKVYGRGAGVVPLEPDLIAEHHVSLVADAELIDGCVAWIETSAEVDRIRLRQDLITVLQRASRPEHGRNAVSQACDMLDHLIEHHGSTMGASMVAVMLDTPGALFSRLNAKIESLDEGALLSIEAAMPTMQLSWLEFSLRLSERLVEIARAALRGTTTLVTGDYDSIEGDGHLAGHLGNLSNRLAVLGRREEALAASLEAMEIHRSLAAAKPEAFNPELATSLNNLGNQLSDLGRMDEALAATQQAVAIRRTLAAERPEAFNPALGSSLNNLGVRLSHLGRREEALTVTEEAVAIHRKLAAQRPEEFTRVLAISLHNLSNRLSALRRLEAALAASEEAITIRRQLAAERPEEFLPDLATSLNSIGNRLSALGRWEEALAASEDAVAIRRQLAVDRTEAFSPNLAMALGNLGNHLSELGRLEEALSASQEAVDLYRTHSAKLPDAFNPDLARSLNNLGACHSTLGHHEESLAAAHEALKIYRALAADRPESFNPHLAGSLLGVGIGLSALGRREEALSATLEAVEIYRRLAAEHPEAFNSDLAKSLDSLRSDLSNFGRQEDALVASQEAVAIRRKLAANRPRSFDPNLARSLNNLGASLYHLGRQEESLATSLEAVEIYRALAKDHAEAFLPDLASSLNNIGNQLSDLGRREAALAASEEAVSIRRALAKDRPEAFLPDLALSLNNIGVDLSSLGRREEALAASEEALKIYRALTKDRPEAFLPDLARSLNNIGNQLSELGRREEAQAAAEEAVEIRRQLAGDRPDAASPDLAE